MGLVIGILLVAALLAFALALGIGSALWFLVVGLVVGAIARLVVPGRQAMGWLSTILFGIAGGLIGGIVTDRAFEGSTIAGLIISVVAAALLIALFSGTLGRDEAAPRVKV